MLNIEWYINNYSDLSENTLGERIRKTRLIKGMLQKEVAAVANLSPETIYNIEN
ncbi:helix-turn-helix domain-containing protein [Senegalia massiliensis]